MLSKCTTRIVPGVLRAFLIAMLFWLLGPNTATLGQAIPPKIWEATGARHEATTAHESSRAILLTSDQAKAWNTFLGSANNDFGGKIAVDESGNLYVVGYSYGTWGNPVNAYAGEHDVLVAKLNSSGELLWHTFLGSANHDYGYGIAVDGDGNVYVVGYSEAAWGAAVNPYAGGADAFAAKLNTEGVRQWHTFLGSGSYDLGAGIAVDKSGNVYLAGFSDATWGLPLNAYAGGQDAFVSKLDSSGVRQWHTFLGSVSPDFAYGIAVDGSGNVHIDGASNATWGTPVNAHAGGSDAFAAKLDNSGELLWHTFLGAGSDDRSAGIVADGNGNVYIAGYSNATWGTPVNAHAGGYDAFAAKLNSSGARAWHTFLGSGSTDQGYDITLDGRGNVYVAGVSTAVWGTPMNPYAGGQDAFAAKLDSSGARQWNTFLGSETHDSGSGVAVDGDGNVYIAGISNATWGLPVNAYAGEYDIFAARLAGEQRLFVPLVVQQ